jgi:hypothetical protein
MADEEQPVADDAGVDPSSDSFFSRSKHTKTNCAWHPPPVAIQSQLDRSRYKNIRRIN